MTQPTTNTPPETVTRDTLCEALRVLGLDPDSLTEVWMSRDHIVVDWHEARVDPARPDHILARRSVVEIVPVATCANCGRGMNAGDAMCCPLPEGGAA